MDTTLKLYFFDGQEDFGFPWGGRQAELLDFTVNKTRMGAAPTITGSLEYPTCLDDEWERFCHFDDVYVVFNGEKYYLKATPTSSKSNDRRFYKHELTFVSERSVLETVYMIDDNENQTSDILYSNNTQYTFFGNIHDFAERINQSMYFSKIGDSCMYSGTPPVIVPVSSRVIVGDGYYVVVDSSVTITDEVLVTLSNSTVFDALKQIFERFGVPYYFVGKVIHIGNYQPISETVQTYADANGVLGAGLENGALVPYEYGQPNAVLNVNRNNGTKQIYNRCSGTGSEDNIPYYYPNNSPSGDISISADENNRGDAGIEIVNQRLFAEKVQLNSYIQCANDRIEPSSIIPYLFVIHDNHDPYQQYWTDMYSSLPSDFYVGTQDNGDLNTEQVYYKFKITFGGDGFFSLKPVLKIQDYDYAQNYYIVPNTLITGAVVYRGKDVEDDAELECNVSRIGDELYFNAPSSGYHTIIIKYRIQSNIFYEYASHGGRIIITLTPNFGVSGYQFFIGSDQTKAFTLPQLGLYIDSGAPATGDRFYQNLIKWVHPQQKLMPTCYRSSDGKKRFYPARNYPLPNVAENNYEVDADLGDIVISNTLENENYKENGTYIHFDNPYRKLKQKEHIEDFPDIKPTIKEMTNVDSRRIDMFLDIAFDNNDDNSGYYDDNGNFVYNHPYFFVKLRKTNGTNGFNLFDHAIDEGEMTIAMTSGHCAPCEFVIGVDKETQKNLVQIDLNSGTLLRDADGNVRCGREGMDAESPQDRQNDTENYEVWIALKKDINTYGEIMPFNDGANVRIFPNICSSSSSDDGDTFVILHIELPLAYIIAAEQRLTEAIIKWMDENNSEKFNLSLKFSRVFLGENTDLVDILNENVKVSAKYNGVTKQFFVSSYSYAMKSSSPIPEITISGLVETVEELKSVASTGGFANSVASHIAENFQELMMGFNKPFNHIINQNNTNVTNQIKGDFPTDYVRTNVDLTTDHVILGAGGRFVKKLDKGADGKVLKMVGDIPVWSDILNKVDTKLSTATSVSNNYGVVTALNTMIEENGTFLLIAQLGFEISNNQQHNAVRVVNAIMSVDEGKNAISSGATELYNSGQITLVAFATLTKETYVKIFVKCDTASVVDIVPRYTHDFATSMKIIRIA